LLVNTPDTAAQNAQTPPATPAPTAYNPGVGELMNLIATLLLYLVKDGELAFDPSDEIQAGVVITHEGAVIHPATAALLAESVPGAGSPGGATP
jgi:NAD(P) transhydrogenase subunit alpha